MKLLSSIITLMFLSISVWGQEIKWNKADKIYRDTTEIKSILSRLGTKDSNEVALEISKMEYETIVFDQDNPTPSEKLKKLTKWESAILKEEDVPVYVYCLLGSAEFEEYRVSYIYLDGSEIDISVIDSLRSIIIREIKNGASFSDLHEEYNMDPNPNQGDLGWFKRGEMIPEFEKAAKEHELNDLFTVDIPEKKWYYVVLKTFENRINKKLNFLKIRSEGQLKDKKSSN